MYCRRRECSIVAVPKSAGDPHQRPPNRGEHKTPRMREKRLAEAKDSNSERITRYHWDLGGIYSPSVDPAPSGPRSADPMGRDEMERYSTSTHPRSLPTAAMKSYYGAFVI